MPITGRPKPALVVTDDERSALIRLTKRPRANRLLAFRARLVLACADGAANRAVARRYRTTDATVGKWRQRFIERRLDGIYDEPRVGAPRTISDEDVEAVIVKTLETTPAGDNALEYSDHGRERRAESYDHRPYLAHVWPEAARHRIVQDLARPAVD
jgi:transposase-like protein